MSATTNTPQSPVVVHARIPIEQLEQLRALAKREDRSLSAEVRRAVSMHVKQAEVDRDA